MIGKQILNYEIKSFIGEGGMGDVYVGEHISIGRRVAIKVLRSDLSRNENIRKRFKNEAKVMASLQHQGIVSLFDYHEDDEGLYLIMEYVDGMDLSELLKDQKEPMKIEYAKVLMNQILEAFAYAHSNDIVHRDVKPANILIAKDGAVKVMDFGIAKMVGDDQYNLTKTGVHVGTAYYMSPEQVEAKSVDLRSDIYSLGITLYEMLIGHCPYDSLGSEYEVYNKIVNEPLISLVDTMGEEYGQIWEVIEKATAKNPKDRFQSCVDFAKALKSEKAKPKVRAKPEKPKTAPVKRKKTNWPMILGVGAGLLVIGLLLWLFLFPVETETEEAIVADGDYIIVKKLNVRPDASVDNDAIDLLDFNDKVELIGNPNPAVYIEDSKIVWQQVKYGGKQGWIALEIDGQRTVGKQSDILSINDLFEGGYVDKSEYDAMRRWALNKVISFVADQQLEGYVFVEPNELELEADFHGLICFHKNEDFEKDDPFDYVTLLKGQGKKMALFLIADEDRQGGELSYCPLPKEACYLGLKEKDDKNIIQVFDSAKEWIGTLDLDYYRYEEKEPEPENWMTYSEVSSTMRSYYNDIEYEMMNAYEYFAYDVIQYINMKNTTPGEINERVRNNTEFLNQEVTSMRNMKFDRVEEAVSYWTYWIDFNCYRSSRSQRQYSEINIEVGFDQSNQIKSYRELDNKTVYR